MLGVARVQALSAPGSGSDVAALAQQRHTEICAKQQQQGALTALPALPQPAPAKVTPSAAPTVATAVGTIRVLHLLPGDEMSRAAVIAASSASAPLCAQLEWKNTPASRKLTSILSAVKRKWANVSGVGSLRLHPCPPSPEAGLQQPWPLEGAALTLTLQQAHRQAAFPLTLVCFYTLPAAIVASAAPAAVTAAPTALVASAPQQRYVPPQQQLAPQPAAPRTVRAPAAPAMHTYNPQLSQPRTPTASLAVPRVAAAAASSAFPSSAGYMTPNLSVTPVMPMATPRLNFVSAYPAASFVSPAVAVAAASAPVTAALLPSRSLLPPSSFRAYDQPAPASAPAASKKAKLTHPSDSATPSSSFFPSNDVAMAALPCDGDLQLQLPVVTTVPASAPASAVASSSTASAFGVFSAADTFLSDLLGPHAGGYSAIAASPIVATSAPPQRTSSVKKSLFASFNEAHASAAAASSPHRRAPIVQRNNSQFQPTATVAATTASLQDVTAAAAAATAATIATVATSRTPLGTLFSTSNKSAMNISNNMTAAATMPPHRNTAPMPQLPQISMPRITPIAPMAAAAASPILTAPATPAPAARIPIALGKENAPPSPPRSPSKLAMLMWGGDADSLAILHALNPSTLPPINQNAPAPDTKASSDKRLRASAAQAAASIGLGFDLNTSSPTPASKKARAAPGSGSSTRVKLEKPDGSGSSKGSRGTKRKASTSNDKKSSKTKSPSSGSSAKGKAGDRKRKSAGDKATNGKRKRSKVSNGIPQAVAEEDDVDWDEWALDLEKELSSDGTESDHLSSPALSTADQVDSPVEPDLELDEELEDVPLLPEASMSQLTQPSLSHEFMAADTTESRDVHAPCASAEEHCFDAASHMPTSFLSHASEFDAQQARGQHYGAADLYGQHDETDWLSQPVPLASHSMSLQAAASSSPPPPLPSLPSVVEFELDSALESELALLGGNVLQFVQAAIRT